MDLLQQAMEKERLKGIRRMNLIRVVGAGVFFVFFVTIDLVLRQKNWAHTTLPVAVYFAFSLLSIFIPTSRMPHLRDYSLSAVDIPLFSFIQYKIMLASDDPVAVAAWSASVFCILVAFSAYGLKRLPIVATVLSAALFQTSLYLLANKGLESIVPSLIVISITGFFSVLMIVRIKAMVENMSKEQGKHQFFSRFFSPQVVTELMREQAKLEIKKQYCSIMFTDIRNFTALAEQTSSHELFAILNEYNDVLVDAIFKYEGTLDKFLGDGILAYFGAPQKHPMHEANAVLCALEIQMRIDELNQTRKASGKLSLDVGVGIHSGEAALGLIGTHDRREYTIIGDTVNLACRIESLTKQLGTQILVSETTASKIGPAISMRNLGTYQVKGRNQGVAVFFPNLADETVASPLKKTSPSL